ncbi:hypothetical protein EIP86_008118 [Pleurotus ostreatoroseus]|nr:hypothetical protein EIP86_008118 [Pleurotus ostreatoroseus]
MSTRVQKGGTIFKPIAKPRTRLGSEARQTSAAPDSRSSVGPSGNSQARAESHAPTPAPPTNVSADDSSSMPPPALIPRRQPPPSPSSKSSAAQSSRETPQRSDETPAFAIATPTRSSVRPPTVQSSPLRPPAIASSSSSSPSQQRTPVPIAAPSRDGPPPIAVSRPRAIPTIIASQTTSQVPPPVLPLTTQPTPPRLASHNDVVSDSQIDPALIQAVVTALRHVETENAASSQQSTQQTLVDNVASSAAPESMETSQDTSQTKGKRGRSKKSTRQKGKAPTSNGADDAAHDDGAISEDQDSDTTKTKKRKRDPNAAPRKRRSRAPSLPPYDPAADPGEEIDPTAVTMADLCEDTGRGRVSSKAAMIMNNHASWRQSNREKRAQMRARMEAKKYGRNPDDEENAGNTVMKEAENVDGTLGPSGSAAASRAQSAEPEGEKGDGYDYTQAMSTSRYNVQVRIGPNGETIIDESSLFVDRNEEEDTAEYTHIEESDTTKFVNSATYSKKLRGSRWSAEETDLFYDALSQFGENYELISLVLPGRDRKACKNKFKAEDKRNPGRITLSLKNRRPYDIATLSRMTGKDFSGPTPEIRAPTPLRMPETPLNASEALSSPTTAVKKKARTPKVQDQDVEIVGDIETLSVDAEPLAA